MATGKTTGLFLLAEDGGGGRSQLEAGLSVFGGVNSRWSEEGGGFRVGEVGGGLWWCEDCGLWLGMPVPRV